MKAYSAAETAGLKTCDYIWQINGKEVFEMSHNDCVKEVKDATTMLSLNVERCVGQRSVHWSSTNVCGAPIMFQIAFLH